MWCFLLLTLFVTVQGRAVNISNTWVLPEEGFPVFYRYFRDRISWYEADAVCQFHHANLVTVDTTAQYDAVRAYLKELDISSAVWVGLIRSNPDGDFTWTDYRGLSGDGYWSSAPDTRSAPLCAAADPAADYRWEARACGGPSVASFICELPVPQWALGNEGCMVRALPALTVLYLPESAAVQLTADCGLAGVKRVQCTGNVKREDLLRELSCTEDDQTTSSPIVTTPLVSWQTATDTTFFDQDTSNEVNTEENTTTEHEDDINQSTSAKLLPTIQNAILSTTTDQILLTQTPFINKLYKVPLEKNINLDIVNNNLLNDIPKIPNSDDFYENSQKSEDEKQMQHKQLHAELARLGNLETVFSQPTDHFVPPLVMAKAKISDDMTALSIEEKLAQQLSEHQFTDHNSMHKDTGNFKQSTSTETSNKYVTTENGINNLSFSTKINENQYSGHTKYILPKKYTKHGEIKTKILKNIKLYKNLKSSEHRNLNNSNSEVVDATTVKSFTQKFHTSKTNHQMEEDTTLELTVIIKEPRTYDEDSKKQKQYSQTVLRNKTLNSLSPVEGLVASPTTEHKVNDEVIKIEIINNNNKHPNIDVTVFELTTKVPSSENKVTKNFDSEQHNKDATVVSNLPSTSGNTQTTNVTVNDLITASIQSIIQNITLSDTSTTTTEATLITVIADLNAEVENNSTMNKGRSYSIEDPTVMYNASIAENNDEINETHITDDAERNTTDTTPEIEDFQSPLLSAANEPLHKPNRSRRPQSLQNRVNKFNPFRILG